MLILTLRYQNTYIDKQRVGADEHQILDHVLPVPLERQMQWRRAINLLLGVSDESQIAAEYQDQKDTGEASPFERSRQYR